MKSTMISILVASLLIIGALYVVRGPSTSSEQASVTNVTMVEGKQIIEIEAKGGYSPQLTSAKADIPTVLKVKTQGTFDCSSALTIPSLSYQSMLPQSGVTEIEIPAQKVGSQLEGLCSMGMYTFAINFN